MSSAALIRWNGARSSALDALVAAHVGITGGVRGRPRLTAEMNEALFMRLSAEFQGFSRELHDEAIGALLAPAYAPDPAIGRVYRLSMEGRRQLDRANPTHQNIADDFNFLGLDTWSAVEAVRTPAKLKEMRSWIDWLVLTRNASAHGDAAKLLIARSRHPITLHTFRTARRKIGEVAVVLDEVVGAHLRGMGVSTW